MDFGKKKRTGKEADEAINRLGAFLEEYESRPGIIDIEGMEKMRRSYSALKKLVSEMEDVSIEYGINEPYRSMGYITLEGKSIDFKDIELFSKAAKQALNFEVYPLRGDAVRMSFGFGGLTSLIK